MNPADPTDPMNATAGSLDRPQDVKAGDHIWTESQLSGLHIEDGLPRFPRFNTATPSLGTRR